MTRDRTETDLDRLTRALRDAPRPEPDARHRALAAAMQAFDELPQGSADEMRSSQDRPQAGAGFLTGVRTMLSQLSLRPVLAATTSAAALGLGLFVVLPLDRAPQGPVLPLSAPVAETAPNAKDAAPRAEADARVRQAATDGLSGSAAETARALDAAEPEAVSDLGLEIASTPAMPAPGGSRDLLRMAPVPLAPPAPALSIAPSDAIAPAAAPLDEAFASAEPNRIKVTLDEPVSTFSVDVDTASYAIVRRSLMSGALPPAEAVRIEEMVNYFPYDYPAPATGEAPFRASVTVMETPWNADTRLVRIGLQGRLPAIADRPPLNLVLLVDTSGSMQGADRLPLLKQSLRLLLPQLRAEDEIAIVAYAGSAGQVLPPTAATEAETILAALDRLEAGGATAGAEGLELAYRTARRMAGAGEVSRVLLATDGDFNVGISDPEALKSAIARERDGGIYLSVLGFGRGNLDDATMQALAQNGNGQAAYIDTLQEARKVLVDQMTGALFPIADDVKIQVEWNPAEVAEYRLIGYETRMLAREDFNNDRVDAGEIGAGHSVTALYEVTAPDSPALRLPPLRYQAAEPAAVTSEELGFLRLRYKAPGETVSALIEAPILPGSGEADTEARFAAAIAGFGQLLTGGTYLGDWGWPEAIALALEGRGADDFGYRAEAISLMRLAESLSAR